MNSNNNTDFYNSLNEGEEVLIEGWQSFPSIAVITNKTNTSIIVKQIVPYPSYEAEFKLKNGYRNIKSPVAPRIVESTKEERQKIKLIYEFKNMNEKQWNELALENLNKIKGIILKHD